MWSPGCEFFDVRVGGSRAAGNTSLKERVFRNQGLAGPSARGIPNGSPFLDPGGRNLRGKCQRRLPHPGPSLSVKNRTHGTPLGPLEVGGVGSRLVGLELLEARRRHPTDVLLPQQVVRLRTGEGGGSPPADKKNIDTKNIKQYERIKMNQYARQ